MSLKKSRNGSRIYNKKQLCLYCKRGFIKIERHLKHVHHNKAEVARATAFPKGSRERKLHLRKRGNFTHNVEVLNRGTGTLIPCTQPSTTCEPQNYLHCPYYQGLYTKKVLWRFKPNVVKKPGKTCVQSLCAFGVTPPPGVKTEFTKLSAMILDEVYSAAKSDELIIEYGQHFTRHKYIHQTMRELGRLLIHSKKTTPMKTIEQHVKPANFMLVVESVKNLAGFVVETSTHKCPSLALKIRYSLKKTSELVESCANVLGNSRAAKNARAFQNVWNEFVSPALLRTLQESKWDAPQLLPFTKDVQTLHSYLSEQQQRLYNELSAEASPQTWANLAKVTLTRVILFNRRRSGEVKMPLPAYQSTYPSSDQDDLKEALADLCEHFRRLEIKGKRGRKVPVRLTPEMQQSLDMLVSQRQECAVPTENIHLFARPSAVSSYRVSNCLRYFASTCGDTHFNKLRKQTATLSQILNLSNTELDQVAYFLGHDIRVHRQFYRLPEGTLQLAKISKVLVALEQGCLVEFKGKSLDDIDIGPEGTAC
uniref:Uncharacterized protein n=1 Tax=Poecilia formosa TaxID=48698 RepID=A0A096LZJ8_POEFO